MRKCKNEASLKMNIQHIKQKSLQNELITETEAHWLAFNADKNELYDAAHEITKKMRIENAYNCRLLCTFAPHKCHFILIKQHHYGFPRRII